MSPSTSLCLSLRSKQAIKDTKDEGKGQAEGGRDRETKIEREGKRKRNQQERSGTLHPVLVNGYDTYK